MEAFDDSEFDLIADDLFKVSISNDINYKVCEQCNCEMDTSITNQYICPNCGIINNVITDNNEYETSITQNYTTNSTFHSPIRCVGKDSFKYQCYIRNYTSNYENIHKNLIVKKLHNKFFHSKKISIPKDIICSAIDKYIKIKEHKLRYRATILDGVLGSLIYYECLKNGIAVKPKEIADWIDISTTKISKSDKILKELQEYNIVDLTVEGNVEYDYLKSYLQRMNVDLTDKKKYVDFIYDILTAIYKYKIGNMAVRLSTKAATLVYLLSMVEDKVNLLDKTISEEFDISLTTIKNYYSVLIKYKEYFSDIFTKYEYDIEIVKTRKRSKSKSKVVAS